MTELKITVCVLIIFAMVIPFTGCGYFFYPLTEAGEDVIRFKIRFDLEEDIGLFLVDHTVNGKEGSGGVSNADKSMIKRNEVLYWDFEKKQLDEPSDIVDLTLRFTVVTEYFDPNYDNIYPEEYMVPMNGISLRSAFGETYLVTVTGGKSGGYIAVLEGAEQ